MQDAIFKGCTRDEYNHLRVEFPAKSNILFKEQHSDQSHDITRNRATIGTFCFSWWIHLSFDKVKLLKLF